VLNFDRGGGAVIDDAGIDLVGDDPDPTLAGEIEAPAAGPAI
jgi:hypothetical protein